MASTKATVLSSICRWFWKHAYAMLALCAYRGDSFGGIWRICSHNLATHGWMMPKPKWWLRSMQGCAVASSLIIKNLVNKAVEEAKVKTRVLVIDRGIVPYTAEPQDIDYATERAIADNNAKVDCVWLESNAPSYLLYTSGTTGTPKGVQRDTGGRAVALPTAMVLSITVRRARRFGRFRISVGQWSLV